VPIGVVALAEAFPVEVDERTFESMVRRVQALLVPIEATHKLRLRQQTSFCQLLGTSGTVTTLAALHLGLTRYDRRRIDGQILAPPAIAAVSARLRAMSNAERAAHPCIGPGRADLVVGGCAILEAVLRSWPPDQLRVADRGLREGMLQGLLGRTLEAALAGPGAAVADRAMAALRQSHA
jgi:exopolyphosphatase/guanosine-5'-triphosphate,3'-diphosphate pyrophosphatase